MTLPSSSSVTRSGFVALIGAPNAGKSTLLNCLLEQILAPVSPKAQTTRTQLMGILTHEKTQIIFIDTPGLFQPKLRLERAMVDAAWRSISECDCALFMIDASQVNQADNVEILQKLAPYKSKLILLFNKIDCIAKNKLLLLIDQFSQFGMTQDIFMISAKSGEGVPDLKKFLSAQIPKGPFYFPEDQVTDAPLALLAAEITREQLFLQLHDEAPYKMAVIPESWETKKDHSVVIRQIILVTKPTLKAMVIGQNGARIKSISESARHKIMKNFDLKAHLFLEVKIDERWQEKSAYYELLGLSFNPSPKKREDNKN